MKEQRYTLEQSCLAPAMTRTRPARRRKMRERQLAAEESRVIVPVVVPDAAAAAFKFSNSLSSSESPPDEGVSAVPELFSFGLQRGSHSYGVQPLGNMFLNASNCNVRNVGLGSLQVLPDVLLLDIFGYLGSKDLGRLALVSKAFYVFAHQDSLWRTVVLENFTGELAFKGCWKSTFLASSLVPGFTGASHVPLKV